MITFKKRCYQATVSTDDRGASNLVGYFTDQDVAKQVVKGKGWWGSDGNVNAIDLHIKIFETREEFDGVTLEDEKAAALAKLSDHDKKVLGFK